MKKDILFRKLNENDHVKQKCDVLNIRDKEKLI